MTIFHWTLPTGGDSRYLIAGGAGPGGLSARGDRPATLDYLGQVARAAEQLGFAGVLAPADEWSEDPWVTAAMLAGATERLRFLVPLLSPALTARMAATFRRYSGDRLRVVGDTDEADLRLIDAVPPPEVAGPAIRLHVITRDTSGQAWTEARRLLAALDPVAGTFPLHGGGASKLEVYPNLWSGVGLARGGATLALVGNHAEVADRIEEYHRHGVDEFVLSGHPHLEEAYWFAEGVLPILRNKGLWAHPYEGDSPNRPAVHLIG